MGKAYRLTETHQKKLIDNLVVKVFVSVGYMTAHIKLGNATEVANIRLEEVKKALEHLFTSVQTLSPLAQRKGFEPLDTFLHHTISNSSNLLIEMIERVLFFHADLSHVKPAQNHVLYRKTKVCGDIDRLQK